jgi:hypothetical protein
MSEPMDHGFRRLQRGALRRISPALGMFFMLPIAVGMEGDSTSTSVGFGAGAGSYAEISRGCEGQVLSKEKRPYQDLAVSIDHQVGKDVLVGLKGGLVRQGEDRDEWTTEPAVNSRYVNPTAAVELRPFGFGIGIIVADAPLPGLVTGGDHGSSGRDRYLPSGHVRIGTRRGYFSMHLLEGMPLVSGGGLLTVGFGFQPRPNTAAWIGLSAPGPYDHAGVLVEAAIPVRRDLHLQAGARYGSSVGVPEYGLSLGLSYRSRRR